MRDDAQLDWQAHQTDYLQGSVSQSKRSVYRSKSTAPRSTTGASFNELRRSHSGRATSLRGEASLLFCVPPVAWPRLLAALRSLFVTDILAAPLVLARWTFQRHHQLKMQTPGTMPNPNNVNVYSAIAQHLANPTILSAEEQLFQDALKTVEARRKKCGKLPKFFDNLTSAKSLQDVHKLLQTEKESNAVWKEPVGKRWMENFSKFADSIWYYKVILDAVGNGSENIPCI